MKTTFKMSCGIGHFGRAAGGFVLGVAASC
jgi:hypothetical protein